MSAGHVATVRQHVSNESRRRKSHGPIRNRLPHDIGHLPAFGLGGLFVYRAFSHHVEPHCAMTHQAAHVDGRIQGFQCVQVTPIAFPGPGQALQDEIRRNVLDGFHHAGQQLVVPGANRGEGHATISDQSRRHAVPADGRKQGIPADLRIEVRVDVDKTRGHDVASRVDLASPGRFDVTDLSDQVRVDREIASGRLTADPVDEQTAANHNIVRHVFTLSLDGRRSTVV